MHTQDLTFIVSFKNMLDNVKLTHALLSTHLTLDPFEDMYNEVNQNVAVGQFRGKVIMHIFR
jgi:L-asparaginase/Glu-tRNA(Gln) amidotransferase subunit D